MPTNDFLPFGTGSGANVDPQSNYINEAFRLAGFGSGLTQSAQLNKVLRQATFPGSAIAQFICNVLGVDAPDNGDMATFVAHFTSAVAATGANAAAPGLTLAQVDAATLTQGTIPTNDNGTRVANTAFVQALVGAVAASLASALTISLSSYSRAFNSSFVNTSGRMISVFMTAFIEQGTNGITGTFGQGFGVAGQLAAPGTATFTTVSVAQVHNDQGECTCILLVPQGWSYRFITDTTDVSNPKTPAIRTWYEYTG